MRAWRKWFHASPLMFTQSTFQVLIRCTLAKMVPPSQQSVVEALRHGVSQGGMILASLTVPMYLHYFKWWCSGVILVNFMLLVIFISRRRSLMLVREIEYSKNVSSKDIDANNNYSNSIGDGFSLTVWYHAVQEAVENCHYNVLLYVLGITCHTW